MITPDLLEILCCPETHQAGRVADGALVDNLKGRVAVGALKNRAGQTIKEKLDAGLVRANGKFLYPVRRHIPLMLTDEAIPLTSE